MIPDGQAPPEVFDHPVIDRPARDPSGLRAAVLFVYALARAARDKRCLLNALADEQPFIALIDDDGHSAHLLTRMLRAHGAPDVRHLGGAAEGRARIEAVLADPDAAWPGLLIVDLKSSSTANLDFVSAIQALLRQKGIPLAVMSQPLDRAGRERLHDAGASTVFFRQAELDAYRREAAAIVSFWARHQRLDAVGM